MLPPAIETVQKHDVLEQNPWRTLSNWFHEGLGLSKLGSPASSSRFHVGLAARFEICNLESRKEHLRWPLPKFAREKPGGRQLLPLLDLQYRQQVPILPHDGLF